MARNRCQPAPFGYRRIVSPSVVRRNCWGRRRRIVFTWSCALEFFGQAFGQGPSQGSTARAEVAEAPFTHRRSGTTRHCWVAAGWAWRNADATRPPLLQRGPLAYLRARRLAVGAAGSLTPQSPFSLGEGRWARRACLVPFFHSSGLTHTVVSLRSAHGQLRGVSAHCMCGEGRLGLPERVLCVPCCAGQVGAGAEWIAESSA